MSRSRPHGFKMRRGLLALSILSCLPLAAHAQATDASTFPESSIRMIVPFPAGGATDVVARIIAQQASTELGKQVVVENKSGAGGTIGAAEAAKAPADGYTVLLTTTSTHSVSPHLMRNLSYDAKADFTPIAHLGTAGTVLLVTPNLPVANVQELIDYAKKNPGALNFASSGNGTVVHLGTEAFMAQAGIEMTHIPYRGTGQSMTDLMAGAVQVLMDAIPTGMPYVKKGQLRALAVTTKERSPLAPEVPTLDESGLPGFESTTWFGVYTPDGVPEDRRKRLHEAFLRAVQDPAVVDRLQTLGVTPAGPHQPEDFARLVDEDSARWKKIIEDGNISIE
jgi:tripartite-type tricarboxylate transporter receptor subunit TctC